MYRKLRFRCSQTYTVFYGTGCERRLSEYDLAVLEPMGQNTQSIRNLKAAGTLTLAYLSVVEINPDHPVFAQLEADDFLNYNGKPIINPTYQNRFADLRSPRWRGALMHLAGRFLLVEGYDGLFLDTIGNVESQHLPLDLRDFQTQAAVDIVRELKKRFPEHLLVQNNGLESLVDYTAGWVDGVCWENPPFHLPASYEWIMAMTAKLRELQIKEGLKVLMLCERTADTEENADASSRMSIRRMAETNGFLFTLASRDYTGLY